MTSDEIRERFTYHPPSDGGAQRHRVLSESFIELAQLVDDVSPDGREKSLAMTSLEQAKFWASAAVARDPATR
jgi:hypothetical protein